MFVFPVRLDNGIVINDPKVIKIPVTIGSISTGNNFAFFLATNGQAFAIGENDCGQLGLGHHQ